MKILRWSLQIILAVYWLFAVVMTHIPKPPPMGPEVSDKLIHFLAYGLLGGLLFLTMWVARPGMRYLPGIVLGILVGNLFSLILSTGFVVPWNWILYGIMICTIVGLAAGFYPAWKAGKLNPIEALRYE